MPDELGATGAVTVDAESRLHAAAVDLGEHGFAAPSGSAVSGSAMATYRTIAAALTAHALNVGYTPVISPGVRALTRAPISHVDQNYLRAENVAVANTPVP